MSESFDVVVIGSGPGGYAAAIRCVQRSATVAVVEKSFIGGTCLNCGCIPSKALLASAHTLLSIKHAALMGVDVASATANWAKMLARKDAIVNGFRKGLTGLIQSHKVKILPGRAVITAPGTLKIEAEGSTIQIQAGKIILATGSEPIELPALPFDGRTVISSKEALGLDNIPKSMVIVGGGVIGCEMACVYAAVGTKVTIVEALSRLIPMEDEWVGRLIEREFKKLGIDSLTSQKVTSVDTTAEPAKVALESGQTIEAEKVLVSVGRRPVVDKETVDSINLQMSDPAISVNEKLETNVPGVYAIGDAVGTTYLAHGAFAEAEVAAVNATGGDEKIADYSLIPRAVYTFPEIASIGKTEQACQKEGLDVSVGKSFFKANGRSVAHNETVGQISAVRDNATNKIIGVTMVGSVVTEMIAAARLLLGSTEKITEVSFPHPTVSEVLKEAAEDAFGLSLHNPPR
ncbi:MAG: dihydrolipoyl dehydrogenase [Phycisphaerae bacterium]|nr:dihydrolipoyl dehydrogenase [Phycisphaerae bacterium]NIP54426.1 dihydrolipoyl dehydrogenase [Phycisphaerae bacterium]NIS53285.1 dihydrolipoyl dehydrogenase [Phycisphaerae bacterium]NIU10811.1 dihydrolipoyl dehydrogenase [Phycisphaerae bacterium]NIU58606.1 dihydrolipoyl dehydrogenase [Phycisphaerae bacterium]